MIVAWGNKIVEKAALGLDTAKVWLQSDYYY